MQTVNQTLRSVALLRVVISLNTELILKNETKTHIHKKELQVVSMS